MSSKAEVFRNPYLDLEAVVDDAEDEEMDDDMEEEFGACWQLSLTGPLTETSQEHSWTTRKIRGTGTMARYPFMRGTLVWMLKALSKAFKSAIRHISTKTFTQKLGDAVSSLFLC